MKTKTLLFTIFFAVVLSSCKEKIEELVPTTMSVVWGDNQTAEVNTVLPLPIEVVVKDQNNSLLSGITVNFAVTEGSLSEQSKVTDSNGKVTVNWTLGATEGTQKITVTCNKKDGTASDIDAIEITTTATPSTKVTDIDGNVYNMVQIGNQVWLKENMKVTRYADGTTIPLVADSAEWINMLITDKAYCIYNNNTNGEGDIYGYLYTWTAATNSQNSTTNPSGVQGICPDGWHIPSEAEYLELIEFLGGQSVAGDKLKSLVLWQSPNPNNNSSEFSALPSGERVNSVYRYINYLCYIWSTSIYSNENRYSHALYLWYYSHTADIDVIFHHQAASVRCLKD